MNSATITIQISVETNDKLDRIAFAAQRSRSSMASAAISSYVERELSIVEGIQQGLADVAAGRLVPHDVAMREARAAIAKVKAKRD